ncbi:winged helix-turn-helix domain-containing protein [Tunturiibacter empetritectus]|uniref:TolB-like protein/Tfp pilus assembly protein PilF n=1 Tax=Tunturiibacter lichenicola TaxID=2051959 RepID=A0A852VFC3_9BACT|nr:winged helix-turn-helix domain-containing protein [Edaphobacter lichenicola]NYF91523.1 TolB-like protein/Tfp pilus assembly protein PilF [Edaphobacter lichenicola]
MDGIELDRRSFSLRRHGAIVRLDPKPLELLFLLVESRGGVISHDEALRRVWGENVFVNGEAALYTAVKKIRQALGDATLIETVTGRGYRLRMAINTESDSAPPNITLASPEGQRLAILPLLNLSNDPEQDYFSDGLTEELISAVSRLLRGQMGVIARTSVMRYRNVSKPVEEIAQELKVDYLVEGSVKRDSGRVRVTVQLLRSVDGTALWCESFERVVDDALAMQSEIALATATAIGIQIAPHAAASTKTGRAGPINAEVHDRYLRARHLLSQRTKPAIQAAMRYLQEALAIDPGFAPATASLALCYAVLPITSLLRPHDCFPAAQSLASDALSLDASQTDAHIALGLVDFWYRRDWNAARHHFLHASTLNPGDSAPPMFLAHIHSILGEHEQALTTLGAALFLDPISPIVRTHHGHFLYNAGRSLEALLPLEQVLEMAPHFWVAHLMRGKALATPDHLQGEIPGLSATSTEAIDSFLLSERFAMGNSEPLAFRIHTLAATGRKAEAEEAFRTMLEIQTRSPLPPLHRGLAAVAVGAHATALELIEEAFAENDVRLVFLLVESRWSGLGKCQYADALQRANLVGCSVASS